MQKPTIILLILALVALIAGALYLPQMIGEPEAPVMQWDTSDEVDGSQDEPEAVGVEGAEIERTSVDITPGQPVANSESRIQAILRGRVVNKSRQPVANAKVWLEIREDRGRGGRGRSRPRRIPEPVVTNEQGLFAFQGEAFRNLRVALQVKHDSYAVGLFDETVGDILATATTTDSAEVNLKDVVLKSGGQVRGRVTDLDGNPVANAEVKLEPQGRNPLRWQRNRSELLPPLKTDGNGYYLFPNVPGETNPDFAVSALAKMHTPGRSQSFQVADEQLFDVPDIQLGPGFECTGFVRDQQGRPIAGADVSLRSTPNRDNGVGNGQAQPSREERMRQMRSSWGRGRNRSTKTDETGRFFLEHLPGAPAELTARAKGYLNYKQEGIDVKLGQLIQVAMDDGLRITGIVTTPDGDPITSYAMKAVRVRGLPEPGETPLDLNEVMKMWREGNMDPKTQERVMRQMRDMRESAQNNWRGRDSGGRGGRGGRDQGRGGRDGRGDDGLGKSEPHPDGKFVADGLQEGIYKVHIQAPEFARFESAEVTVRHGLAAPDLTVTVDPGVYIAGVVLDNYGDPVVGARVELETASLEDSNANRNGGNRGGSEGGRRGRTMDVGRMAQSFLRGMNGTSLSLEARTDEDGVFSIKHIKRGVFRLSASADSFTAHRGEPFQLDTNRTNFEITLQPLGSIVGTVAGLLPEDVGEVSVGAMIIAEGGGMNGMASMFRGRGGRGGGSSFKTGKVEADGSYRLDGLNSGNYVVRTWIGSTRQMMRELGPAFMTGELQPDVAVAGGKETQWNMTLERPQIGTVSGNVLHNGSPANGFRVELRKQADAGSAPDTGGRGGRGGRGFDFFSRSLSATVSATGEFTIKDVPAGSYDLRISSGGRRGSTLLSEPVQVFANDNLNRTFSVTTGSLKGTISVADGTDVKTIGGSVSLVPNQVALPAENLRDWLRENNAVFGRLRDGAFEFETVSPGAYLLVLQPRNRAPTAQQVAVSGAESVEIAAGAVVENPDPTGNGAGPGFGGGNRAGRGGGGGARGGRGGGRGGR